MECRGLRFCYGRVRALLTSSMPGGMWWGYAHAGRASRCGTVLSFCLLFVFLRVPLWGLADLRRIAAGTVCLGVLCALFLWFVVFVFFGLLILCAPFGPGWPPPRHGGHGWPRDAIFSFIVYEFKPASLVHMFCSPRVLLSSLVAPHRAATGAVDLGV